MGKITASDTYKARDLWFGSGRGRIVAVFSSIFAKDPALRYEFLKTIELMLGANQPDRLLYLALKQLYMRHQARFEVCLSGDAVLRQHRRMEEIKAQLPAGFSPGRILDVGSGNGAITAGFARAFAAAAGNVYGIDFIAPWPQHANFKTLKYTKGGKVPAPVKSFDFATILMVLHHTPQPGALLKEAHRVLSPGGFLLVRETDAHSKAVLAFNTVMDEIFYSALHENSHVALSMKFNFQSAAAWKRLFRKAGFRVVKTDRQERDQPFAQTWFLLKKQGRASAGPKIA